MIDLIGAPFDQVASWLDARGVGARHANRVYRGVHRQLLPIDQIPGLGRHGAALAEDVLPVDVRVERAVVDEDGTEKLLLVLGDGARIECVLVPMPGDRVTLCVSSQVGCAMACAFCATGTLGLARNLTSGEIIAQVHHAMRQAASTGRTISRVVFMGMGEPLHNDAAVYDALRVLLDGRGLAFGTRNVTVSTVGLVPKIREFSAMFEGKVQLALSLHAGTDETRRRIIPAARRYDLASLKAALLDHPLPNNRWMMLEYVVLPGINDTDAEIDALIAWHQGLRAVVNLLHFNPFPGAPFVSPTYEQVTRVQRRLREVDIPATVRMPRGRSAAGACGQLALREVG
jgi:23S rRNA (adenine2503-C2)-methyltransferase